MDAKKLFIETLVGQVRALDQFGTWTGKSNEELIVEKYIRTKEDLKNIPIIADIDEMQIKDIRLIFQAV
ncbi:MAG: NifX-associated nitrogen fixation protein, partial [Campylobacterales bacterium]|nr:NifX-associated nitrogen fixation protein [Campylobacterales bacterium]